MSSDTAKEPFKQRLNPNAHPTSSRVAYLGTAEAQGFEELRAYVLEQERAKKEEERERRLDLGLPAEGGKKGGGLIGKVVGWGRRKSEGLSGAEGNGHQGHGRAKVVEDEDEGEGVGGVERTGS
ncbi:MAG: hypothetical protein Q9227_008324 [Pyrenula ochraceoflavens]